MPLQIELGQNTPNPFLPATSIKYNTNFSKGFIEIVSPAGKLVFSKQVQGLGTLEWNAKGLASGIYVYRLVLKNRVLTRKMVLMK